MRLATFTLFGFIMICPVCAFPQTTLWDVAPINKGLFNIGIAHGIRKNCTSIKANTLVGITYVWKLIGHATEKQILCYNSCALSRNTPGDYCQQHAATKPI